MPGKHQHGGSKAQARRSRRDEGKEGEGGGNLADPREVMLRHEARMKAERFSFHVGLDEVVKALRSRCDVEGA